MFITIEGPEGAGKTTQIIRLSQYLKEKGIEHILTREPGGTVIGNAIRDLLLKHREESMSPVTEALLYAASRAQLVAQVIKPALEKGLVVLCDRYVDSSLAYQGAGLGLDMSFIKAINEAATSGLAPDITFLLDLDPEIGLKRKLKTNSGSYDRIEQRDISYHRRIRKAYLELAEKDRERFRVIDATLGKEEIQSKIREIVKRHLEGSL